MKWLFLINDASYLFEFLGKISHQLTKEGDECLVVFNSKIAEYEKGKFFPKNSKFLSKIDWCIKNYDSSKKDFGNLSWRELFTVFERFNLYNRYNYNQSLDIVNQLYQFFDYIFSYEKPDIVIGEPPPGLFGEVAYYFTKKNNIPFCGIAESRFPGRIDIWDLEWTCSKFEDNFKNLKKEDFLPGETEFAKNFIKKFISHKTIYSSYYIVKVRFSLFDYIRHYLRRLKESSYVFFRYFLDRSKVKRFDYESEAVLRRSLMAPFRTIKKNIKIKLQGNIFNKLSSKDKYFFFPIQYEPEASTLVLATYYSNQLATIKYVSATLPFPYKLCLKEHPGSIGSRTNQFYEEIKKIPNAVLLSSEESTPNVIANSIGVITMTSTVGMEAAIQGKPVYVLGNVFYSYHPLCQKVVNFEDLKEKIKRDLQINWDLPNPIRDQGVLRENETKQTSNGVNLEEINMRFIISYLRNSILADILYAKDPNDKNNYQFICKEIKRFLTSQK
ncbi:MAG: hypothetical protein AAB340_00490 [Patescibacteria group bacterium]